MSALKFINFFADLINNRFGGNTTHLCNAYPESEFLLVHFHNTKLDWINPVSIKNFYKMKYGNVLVHKRNHIEEFMTIVKENDEGKKEILESNITIHINFSYIVTPEGDVIQSLKSKNKGCDIWKDQDGKIDYRDNLGVTTTLIITESTELIQIPIGDVFQKSNNVQSSGNNTTHLCNVYPKSDHLLVHFHKHALDIFNANKKKFYKIKYGDVLVYNRSEITEYMTVVAETCKNNKEVILFSNFILNINLSYIITPEGKAIQSLYSHQNCNIWVGQEDKIDYGCKLEEQTTTTHILATVANTIHLHVGDLAQNSYIAQMEASKVYETKTVNDNKRGRLLILNYKKFNNEPNLTRFGTQYDVFRLKITFKKLGFDVCVKKNLPLKETLEALKTGKIKIKNIFL